MHNSVKTVKTRGRHISEIGNAAPNRVDAFTEIAAAIKLRVVSDDLVADFREVGREDGADVAVMPGD